MTKMGKVMIAFSLIWIFVWCIAGFYLGMTHLAYNNKMAELAKQGNLVDFWNTFSAWKHHSVAHAHAIGTSFILILIALVMPYIKFSDKVKWTIGLLLIIGVALYSIFDWFFFDPLLIAGGILIVAMVLVSFIGALRGIKK